MNARHALCLIAVAAALSMGFHLVEAGTAITADANLQRVDERQVRELDSATWPGWLALRLDEARPTRSDPRSMLGLADGQRIAGEFEGIGSEMWWRHRELGSMQIDLEQLAWIGPPSLAIETPPARDRLLLVNGDRVEGFVNALHADRGVEMEVPGAANEKPARTWFDLGRAVACIQLAPRPAPSSGWRLWLRDGSVIDVNDWQHQGDRLVLKRCHLPGLPETLSIAWDSLAAVQDARRGVRALSTMPWKGAEVPDSPRLAPVTVRMPDAPSPLDIRPIDLHGPGLFTVSLPSVPCAVDFTMQAPPALADDVACTVQVLDGEREIRSVPMKAHEAAVHVHALVQQGPLRLRVQAGSRGAYGSAVRLIDAVAMPTVTAEAPASPVPSSVPAKPSPQAAPGTR